RALASLVVLASCSNPSILMPDPPPAERIGLGRSIDAELGATPHRYRLELAKDQVARGAVLQQGVDALITVYDPSGKKLGDFDSHTGDQGPEPFTVVGSDAGPYDLEVHAWVDEQGKVATGRITTHIDAIIPRDTYEDELLAKTVDSPRVRELFRALRHHVPGAADAFWKQLVGHEPIVEPYPQDPSTALVTWVMRSPQAYVGMVGGPSAREKPMVRIADSDLFYLSARVPTDARLIYGFIPDSLPPSFHQPHTNDGPDRYADMELDPNNPRAYIGLSVLELPGAPPATVAEVRPGAAKGTLTEIKIASTALKEDRRVGVYLPPGYDPKQTYPLVIAFDGEVYGLPGQPALVPVPTILDNLLADGKLPPVVAMIVANQNVRDKDLAYSAAFSDFVAGEIVPRARADYHAGLAPAQTLVTGSSLGGLASSFLALHHSDVIGNVLSNSGAYQVRPEQFVRDLPDYPDGERLSGDFVSSPKLPIRFYLDCGVFEDELRDSNRRLRDVLRAKGYDVTYREFSGNHDYGQWRRTIADGLVALLGQRS
ncbi:MAG TPA: alpha/beta hydrolase-fold protein, partial [Kofleriaceae bacterium]|nr:alpha/beta hydrolase-fold protein [Kofleriaceae bacterium]